MDENRRSISSPAPYPPNISIPASSENLFAVGSGGAEASLGPMTSVSNFFSDNDMELDYRSSFQLLAGGTSFSDNVGAGGSRGVDFQFINAGRPSSLAVTQASMFTIPPGLCPATLLNSPGFFPPGLSPATLLNSPGFFPPAQGSYGTFHQQASAQVTPQYAQLPPGATTHPRIPPPPMADNYATNPKLSNSGSHSQPHSAHKPDDDGYNWRKYGENRAKGSEDTRSYYRCTHQQCPATKKVDRSPEGRVTSTIYKKEHNHQRPRSVGTSGEFEPFKGQTHNSNDSRKDSLSMNDQESAHEEPSDSDAMKSFRVRAWTIELRDADKTYRCSYAAKLVKFDRHGWCRNAEVNAFDRVSSHQTVMEPRVVFLAISGTDLLDDGYKWLMYGNRYVNGSSHPRSYYKCTSVGCNV